MWCTEKIVFSKADLVFSQHISFLLYIQEPQSCLLLSTAGVRTSWQSSVNLYLLCTGLGSQFDPKCLLRYAQVGSGKECWWQMEIGGRWVRRAGKGGAGPQQKGSSKFLLPTAQCSPGSSSSAPATQVRLCKEQRS